jgi:hypothetical protein
MQSILNDDEGGNGKSRQKEDPDAYGYESIEHIEKPETAVEKRRKRRQKVLDKGKN